MLNKQSLFSSKREETVLPRNPWPGSAPKAAFERSAQRKDNSIARSISAVLAGSATHSSNCI